MAKNRRAEVDERTRASDADRDGVTARLRDHFAEGRLTRDELDERIAAALNARTFGDLRRVLADLPEPRPPEPRAAAPGRVRPMTARRPYPVLRRRPSLFPLIALALLTFAAVSGAGAAVVVLKVVLSVVALMFVFTMIAAITAATFIRRARRHWHSQWYAAHFDRDAGNWQTRR